ncbi:MAG: serine/threonine protein kinase [Myxococcales bacterium]|nr:serine/threonine protein kinase [Myxococcales bacterium]
MDTRRARAGAGLARAPVVAFRTMDDGVTRFDDERSRALGARVPRRAQLDAAPFPNTGEPIGRYVVLSTLGAGAMGVVLSAYDPELDRKIAIKLLKGTGVTSKARARLRREAQALARLNHPNVVTVHDVGVHAGRVFVAMEFVKGETLGEWTRARPGAWAELVRVFRAAGRGLAAAHETGLIHRDFKPENVMIGGLRRQLSTRGNPGARHRDSAMVPAHGDLLGASITRRGWSTRNATSRRDLSPTL